MKALLKEGLVVLIPQSDADASTLASWRLAHEDHVLNVRADRPGVSSLELHDMGRRLEACREPLNVVSSSSDPFARAISNLATAPFELDGRIYQSVESFWQSLKFEDEADRASCWPRLMVPMRASSAESGAMARPSGTAANTCQLAHGSIGA